MRRITSLILASLVLATACGTSAEDSATEADRKAVEAQQSQYSHGQPIPAYDWSLERDLLIQLYNLRNEKAATHAVWRSNTGKVEGDCPSIGFGLPYDTSLTNPSKAEWVRYRTHSAVASAVVGQAEPNGIFASTNTSATWVMCVAPSGRMAPIYVEAKVTVYPYAVSVDYSTDRVSPVPGSPQLSIGTTKE